MGTIETMSGNALTVIECQHGLIITQYRNGAIVAYLLSVVNNDAIQTLLAQATEVVRAWPADKPYLALVEFAHHFNVDFGRFMPGALELVKLRPELVGKTAYVIPATAPRKHIQQFLEDSFGQGTRPFALFSDRHAAIAWLERPLDHLQAMKHD